MLIFFALGASTTLVLCLIFIWLFMKHTRKAICVAPPGSRVSRAFGAHYRPQQWEYQRYER